MQRDLTITMSSATVQALADGDLALYGFAATGYGPLFFKSVGYGGGYPLVWFRVTRCLPTTTVTLSDPAAAFISVTPLAENAVIALSVSAPVALGQTVQVADGTGLLTTQSTGQPGAISLINQGATPWTCGLAADAGAGPAPICAFPLRGNSMDVIRPTARVLVMFAIDNIPVGAAVTTAYAAGLLIDFEAGAARTVAFDIDKGWDAGGAVWAKRIPPQTDLGALLITP